VSARDEYERAPLTQATYEAMCDKIDNLSNALKWIRQNATLHYLGGAFDPEHMGELANQATSALDGEPVPDYDEAMAAAKVKAQEWMVLFSEGQTDDVQDVRDESDASARAGLDQDPAG
jgi:hypothetical protein